jgi:hypothetical protein
MNKFDPEIVSLRRDIENEVKRKIKIIKKYLFKRL